jgi:hypothetical protein
MTQRIGSNRIANTAVIGLKLADNSIRGNNIVAGQITGNLIGTAAISSNHIADLAVTGNELGLNSVSSNNFTANIQFNSSRIIETVNVSTIAATGNVNIDVSNATVHYFTANTTANCTFNLRANATHRLDSVLANGQSISVAIGLSQGATQYFANIYIDGVLQTSNTRWMGNVRPSFNASIGNAFTDFYNITAIKTGSNAYVVLAGNTVFGVGS